MDALNVADYTVAEERGCRVVRGHIPAQERSALVLAWSRNGGWVLEPELAEALGAVLVCGPRAVIEAWRVELAGWDQSQRLRSTRQ